MEHNEYLEAATRDSVATARERRLPEVGLGD